LSGSARATEVAGDYIFRKTDWIVDNFSSAKRLQQALDSRARDEKIGRAALSAFAMLANAATLALPIVGLVSVGAQFGALAVNLASNTYIGIAGIQNAGASDAPKIKNKLADGLRSSLNEVLHGRSQSIDDDIRDLMVGAPNHRGLTIIGKSICTNCM